MDTCIIEVGIRWLRCFRCSIYFPRGGNRALLSHLRICLDSQGSGLENGGYPCAGLMRVTSANRKHSQSPRDFVEFSRCHYEAPRVTKVVHPLWKYERSMWPRIEPQQADQYLTSMTTSPLITIKVINVFLLHRLPCMLSASRDFLLPS